METKAVYKIEEINERLIECCINCNPTDFLPYLLSPSVSVSFPNKIRFFSYFKSILKCARTESKGKLELRIEQEFWTKEENIKTYNFYDEVDKYPRINLKVKEENNNLYLDLMPF